MCGFVERWTHRPSLRNRFVELCVHTNGAQLRDVALPDSTTVPTSAELRAFADNLSDDAATALVVDHTTAPGHRHHWRLQMLQAHFGGYPRIVATTNAIRKSALAVAGAGSRGLQRERGLCEGMSWPRAQRGV